jgi:hypothetical protein
MGIKPSVGGVLMVRSNYKIWVQTKGSSVFNWLQHGSVALLWSHLIIFICNISPLQHPLRKSKLHIFLCCHSAHLSRSPGCLKLLIGAHTKGPALETSHSKNVPSPKVPSLKVPRHKMSLSTKRPMAQNVPRH